MPDYSRTTVFILTSLIFRYHLHLSPDMGARNQVGIGLSYRHASLCSLATQFLTRFLESIPRPIAGLKILTLSIRCWNLKKNYGG
jgi:hypothetical protein